MALTRNKHPRLSALTSPESHSGNEFSMRDDSLWFMGRNHLVHTCKLPSTLVDDLHAKGHLYTDNNLEHPSLVFLHVASGGQVAGASLFDFAKEPPSFRIKGASNSGWFTVGDLTTAREVIVCENPIDTLSCYSLHQSRDLAAVSCAGPTIPMSLMLQLYESRQNLLVAFNNSPEADRQWLKAWDTVADWPGFNISALCPKSRDWNTDLIEVEKRNQGKSVKI